MGDFQGVTDDALEVLPGYGFTSRQNGRQAGTMEQEFTVYTHTWPTSAVVNKIVRTCTDAGLTVTAGDVVKAEGEPVYTIDGMEWEDWFEAMTEMSVKDFHRTK